MNVCGSSIVIVTLSISCAAQGLGQDSDVGRKKLPPSVAVSSSAKLLIAVDNAPKPPDWWLQLVNRDEVRTDRIGIVKAAGERWRFSKDWNAWLPMALTPKPGFIADFNGKTVDLSPLVKSVDTTFFQSRIVVTQSDEWSISAVCLNQPSDVVLLIANERSEPFTYRIKSFVPETVGGSHVQILQVEIFGDYAVTYVANYLGVSFDIVNLRERIRVVDCSMRFESTK